MVDAALVGLEQGEVVTIPGLLDGEEWTRFDEDTPTLAKQFGCRARPRNRKISTSVEIAALHAKLGVLAGGGMPQALQQRREVGEALGDEVDHLALALQLAAGIGRASRP